MGKKYRKNNKAKILAQLRATKTKVANAVEILTHRDEQQLSTTDKLVWAYKEDLRNQQSKNKPLITEIVTVAYITIIDDKEYTVIHYDSAHDKILHMHVYKSIHDSTDTIIPLGVRKKGNQSRLLNWALKDIRNRWYFYRKQFYKRSGIVPDF